MRKILLLLWIFLLSLQSLVWAETPNDQIIEQPKTTVIVVLDQEILSNTKALPIIKNTLVEKFKQADVLVVGDPQAKSPEFLELMDKVKTDTVNEKGIRFVSTEHLANYGKEVHSKFIVLVSLNKYQEYEEFRTFYRDVKARVFVLDVDSQKIISNQVWYKEKNQWISEAAEGLVKKIKEELNWPPLNATVSNLASIGSDVDKKMTAVVFVDEYVLAKKEVGDKIRKTFEEKFKLANVPINLDVKPKSLAFLELETKVAFDSIKQSAFLLKKEHLVQYGKQVNADYVLAMNISIMEESGWNCRLQEDISIVDVGLNKYVSNNVYDTGKTVKRLEGVDMLLNKLLIEYKLTI